jgi:hypothetical protein
MTAVEWLFLMLNDPNKNQEFARKLLDKALELEKQQIENAYDHCRCIGNFDSGTEYYNETYKPST